MIISNSFFVHADSSACPFYPKHEESGSSSYERYEVVDSFLLQYPYENTFLLGYEPIYSISEIIAIITRYEQIQELIIGTVFEKFKVLFPEISPDLIKKIENKPIIKDSLRKILFNIKRMLQSERKISSLRVESLDDPEGVKTRIYFVLTGNIAAMTKRRELRNRVSKIIDETIKKIIEIRRFKKDCFLQLRAIFGVIVEGP